MNYTELKANINEICENEFADSVLAMFTEQAEQKIYNTVQIPALRKNVTGTVSANNKYLQIPSDFLYVYSLAVYSTASTTATGVSGELAITVTSPTNIEVDQLASGTGIGTGARVRSISGNTVALSVPNTGTVSGTISFQGDYKYLLDKDVNFIREAYPNPVVTGLPKHYAIFDDSAFILGPTPNTNYSMELHYGYYPESIVTAGTSWLGTEFDTALLNGALVEAIRYMKGEPDVVQMYEKLYVQSIGLLKNLGDGKLRQDTYRSGQVRIPVS